MAGTQGGPSKKIPSFSIIPQKSGGWRENLKKRQWTQETFRKGEKKIIWGIRSQKNPKGGGLRSGCAWKEKKRRKVQYWVRRDIATPYVTCANYASGWAAVGSVGEKFWASGPSEELKDSKEFLAEETAEGGSKRTLAHQVN